MTRCGRFNVQALLAAALIAVAPGVATGYVEPPVLMDRVKSGELPAIDQRLPTTPRVMDFAKRGLELG